MDLEITQFLNWLSIHAGKGYIQLCKRWLRRLDASAGKKPLSEVTIDDIAVFRATWELRVKMSTLAGALTTIKTFLKFFIVQGRRCVHPDLIKIPKFHVIHHPHIEKEEVDQIHGIPRTTFLERRDYVIHCLLWDTNMRVSELCALNTHDVKKDFPEAVIPTKKTTRYRMVMWSRKTHKLLLDYLEERMPMTLEPALFIGVYRDGSYSKRLCQRSVQRIIRCMMQKAGIHKKLSPHSYRHGWAHYRIHNGIPLAAIPEAMGHVDIGSSKPYIEFTARELKMELKKYL